MTSHAIEALSGARQIQRSTMKALVFHAANDIRVEQVSMPRAGFGEAGIRVTLTTICGTQYAPAW